jgi:hypothetical protein
VKIMLRRRFAVTLATLAAAAFGGGAFAASQDPAAGTAGFVKVVAKRMRLTPKLLRLTVEDADARDPPESRGVVPHGDRG